mgnify:CR=1 FL=1
MVVLFDFQKCFLKNHLLDISVDYFYCLRTLIQTNYSEIEPDEPIFNEPWEPRAFAMAVSLNEAGQFTWSEWADVFGELIAENTRLGDALSYYQVWMNCLETIMLKKRVVESDDIKSRRSEWEEACLRTPHGEAIEL